MRILFLNTHYYMPQSFGGMSITLHHLCVALGRRGHDVSVLCGLRKKGSFGLRTKIFMKLRTICGFPKIALDRGLGYRVWRCWSPIEHLDGVCNWEQPDIIVIMGGKAVPAARAARQTGVPILVQVHDVETHFHGGDFAEITDLPCVANSHFTAEFYLKEFGARPSVIYPYIDEERYSISADRSSVVFVNPYVHKGLREALAIASQCPEIPFVFVGKLPDGGDDLGAFATQVCALANVRLLSPTSNMKEIYRMARILLAPSQWQEAYGRVAAEAQISGIPVIGSSQGGLPEAIGDGGIVLAPNDPIEEWSSALRSLWNDKDQYKKMKIAAFANARRRKGGIAEQEKIMRDTISSFNKRQQQGSLR